MKKNTLRIFGAFLILIGLIGCQPSSKSETENDSTITKAIENGKLALADGDYVKSKSNFELALAEDKENKEAENWLVLVGKIELLSSYLEDKEIEKTEEAIVDIKSHDLYKIIKSQIDDYEFTLATLKSSIENVDNEIVALNEKLEEGAL